MLPPKENYQGCTHPGTASILRAKIVELLAVGYKARLVSNPEQIATVLRTREFRGAGAASLLSREPIGSRAVVDYTPVEPDPSAPLHGLWELSGHTARHVCPFRQYVL